MVVVPLTWYNEEGARYALVEVRYTGASCFLARSLPVSRLGCEVEDVVILPRLPFLLLDAVVEDGSEGGVGLR